MDHPLCRILENDIKGTTCILNFDKKKGEEEKLQRVMFMGAIYLIWIFSRKYTTSPNIQHPISNYKRKPRLFQMMLNYL
jgi:hypothetical protein